MLTLKFGTSMSCLGFRCMYVYTYMSSTSLFFFLDFSCSASHGHDGDSLQEVQCVIPAKFKQVEAQRTKPK